MKGDGGWSWDRIVGAASGFGVLGLVWLAIDELASLIGPGPHQLARVDPEAMARHLISGKEVSWRGVWFSNAVYPGDGVMIFAAIAIAVLVAFVVGLALVVHRLGQERSAQVLDQLLSSSWPSAEARRRIGYIVGAAAVLGIGWYMVARGATGTLVLLGLLLLAAALVVDRVTRKGPHGISTRFPWKVTTRPRPGWWDGPWLGWTRGALGRWRWLIPNGENSARNGGATPLR